LHLQETGRQCVSMCIVIGCHKIASTNVFWTQHFVLNLTDTWVKINLESFIWLINETIFYFFLKFRHSSHMHTADICMHTLYSMLSVFCRWIIHIADQQQCPPPKTSDHFCLIVNLYTSAPTLCEQPNSLLPVACVASCYHSVFSVFTMDNQSVLYIN
jgi:hypothetical protein